MAGAEAERGVRWERDRDDKQLGEEVGVRAREKVKDRCGCMGAGCMGQTKQVRCGG